jgi:hypothetical protein
MTASSPTIHVKRMYDSNWQPASIWHCDADRKCTSAELQAAANGSLYMVEARIISGHPSYGRGELLPDGTSHNWPSQTVAGDDYTLSPANIREFYSCTGPQQ